MCALTASSSPLAAPPKILSNPRYYNIFLLCVADPLASAAERRINHALRSHSSHPLSRKVCRSCAATPVARLLQICSLSLLAGHFTASNLSHTTKSNTQLRRPYPDCPRGPRLSQLPSSRSWMARLLPFHCIKTSPFPTFINPSSSSLLALLHTAHPAPPFVMHHN